MLNPDQLALVAEWAQILSVLAAAIFGAYKVRQALDRRDAELENRIERTEVDRERLITELTDVKAQLRKEFSGNSGGIREAINRIGVTVERVDDKADRVALEVAELRGRFDQHLTEPPR
jgi:methyl-accepting chemotaxis protein